MLKLTSKELEQRFIKKLRDSGLSKKEAKKLQMIPFTAEQAKKLNVPAFAGFKIPYFDLNGKPTKFYRVRYLETTKTGIDRLTNKKEMRYIQPSGTLNEVYIPPLMNWKSYIEGPEPLFITEGELKAAAATHRGFPTLGLGGVNSYMSKKRGISLLPIFHELNLQGRHVFIVYDSDAATNPQVAAAESAFCREISNIGAVPFIIRLPSLDDKKTGLDDYLLQKSDEEFTELTTTAEPYKLASELHKLNEEVIAVMNPGFVYEIKTGAKLSPRLFTDFNYAPRTFLEETILATGEIKVKKVSTAKAWITWPNRSQVSGIVYAPGEPEITENKELNLWKGWPHEPKPGNTKPWEELLDFIFTGEPETRRWFEQWCAYPLQHPGTKLFSAVVIWGRHTGTGKTLAGYTLMKLYGENAVEIGNEELESKDNDYAENKQFVVGEEITGGDKRGLADKLKSMVTRETVRINIKYVAKFTIKDCINYYFTSNHPDAFYLDKEDRRYFIHEVKGVPMPEAWYAMYDKWYKSKEGMEALFHYLLNLDLKGFKPFSPPPMTSAKLEMISSGRSELDSWTHNLLEDPDGTLRVSGTIVNFSLFRGEDLLNIYDPAGLKRVTTGGMGRALTRAGFRKPNGTHGCKSKEGQLQLWAIRTPEKFMNMSGIELGAYYDQERELKQPKFMKKEKS